MPVESAAFQKEVLGGLGLVAGGAVGGWSHIWVAEAIEVGVKSNVATA